MKPTFYIPERGAQDKVDPVSCTITETHLKSICKELTSQTDFERKVLPTRVQGKMFRFETNDCLYYITYTSKDVGGRNSYLQSVPTALAIYLKESLTAQNKKTKFCLYITTPKMGNNLTSYHIFIYRLLKTIGVKFLNEKVGLSGHIFSGFNNTRDLIDKRNNNRGKNSANQSSYITDEGSHYHIYGKTFGANQKETTLLCMALCKISDKPIRLFQIADNKSECLSSKDIVAINTFVDKYSCKPISILDDTYEFDESQEQYKKSETKEDSLRSARFTYNLLQQSNGHKRCALCGCEIESIVQGAHIFPVCAIKKRTDLDYAKKLEMATDKYNGLWLCENHHKLFDSGLIKFDRGSMKKSSKLNSSEKNFVDKITTTTQLTVGQKMQEYFNLRDAFYRSENLY